MRLSFRHGDLHTMAVYQSSTAQSPRPLVLTAGPRHTIQRSSAAFAVLAESTPVRLQGQSLAHCLAAIGAGRRVPLLDQVYLTRAPWILHDQEHAHPTMVPCAGRTHAGQS